MPLTSQGDGIQRLHNQESIDYTFRHRKLLRNATMSLSPHFHPRYRPAMEA